MAEMKERLNNLETGNQKPEARSVPDMVDVAPRAHVPENVKSWLERIEMDPDQPKMNDDTNGGQPTLQLPAPQDPKIQLPTTRKSFLDGFAKKMDEAGKWLSTFLLRVIKIKGGKVKFKEE